MMLRSFLTKTKSKIHNNNNHNSCLSNLQSEPLDDNEIFSLYKRHHQSQFSSTSMSLFSLDPTNSRSSHKNMPISIMNSSSSNKSNSNTTIARLISKRDWSTLEHLCADPNDLPPIDAPHITHAVTSEIVLHFACRFQAPLRTISLLATLFSVSLERPDATGRYPIHVAAKWGATPDVIHFLICSNPAVVGVPDDLGKTPMHYVGEFYGRNYSRHCPYPVNEAMLQVVKLLKSAAPKSVNLEDREGMNAIEYALESHADIKVIKSMQRACRDDWRDMKSHAAGKRHDELAREVVENAVHLQRQFSSRRMLGMAGGPPQQEQQVNSNTNSNSNPTRENGGDGSAVPTACQESTVTAATVSDGDVSMEDVSGGNDPAASSNQRMENASSVSNNADGNSVTSSTPIKIDVGRINFHRSTAQARTRVARTA
mmetsp:Transcript_19562/g.41102  ORF Transcript_19562/g.41102 Transcript_19562/m.41102 type:complete len:427 (+) Transcript_19562:154-1434(+)